MIHPFTLACALLAVGSGAWVYQSKHSAQLLDRDINRTMKSVDDARGRTGMLRAEYALLNDPSRLQELAEQHLALKTTSPVQFARLADLSGRLPAVGSFKPVEAEPVIQPMAAQMIAAVAAPPAPAIPAALPPAAPRAKAPVRAPSPIVTVAAQVTPQSTPAPASVVRAAPPPRLLAASAIERTPLPPIEHVAAAPRPARAAVAYAPATYAPAPVAYAPAAYRAPATYQVPAYQAPAYGVPATAAGNALAVVASALGMARSTTLTAGAYEPRGGDRN
jgi:hypothetical protein